MTMSFPYFARLALAAFAPLAAVDASTILDNVDAQLYRDKAADYESVGTVTGGFFNGSGVLISDRWVLTAGHITDFRSGGTYRVGGVDYTIQSVFTHPQHALFGTTYDVGLLYLSSSVTDIQPETIYAFSDPASLLGREATWVGNGLTGTGADLVRGPNEMRAFTNIIDGYTPYSNITGPSFFADFDNPAGTSNSLADLGSSATPTALEGNVTPGDSGGGVFITIGGQRYLVGINSYASGFSPGLDSRYGALSGAANLAYFHEWIYQTSGVITIPEPSGAMVFGGLAGIVFLRRRR